MNKFKMIVLALSMMIGTSVFAAVPSDAEMKKVADNIKSEYNKLKTDDDKLKYRFSTLKDLEKEVASNLPVKMSQEITWERVKSYYNGQLVYTYKVNNEMADKIKKAQKQTESKAEFKKTFSDFLCGNEVMKSLLEIGTTVELEYVNSKNDRVISNIELNRKDCD